MICEQCSNEIENSKEGELPVCVDCMMVNIKKQTYRSRTVQEEDMKKDED